MTIEGINVHSLLNFTLNSNELNELLRINSLNSQTESEIKIYSNLIYSNQFDLGYSLQFTPINNYKLNSSTQPIQLQPTNLKLTAIDIYNSQAKLDIKPTTKSYSTFPIYPIQILYPQINHNNQLATFNVTEATKGHEFTQILGEPDRKGGGEGSMGIWCEWINLGLMIEFASGGLQAWEKGAESTWRCCTIFERGVKVGQDVEDE